MNLLFLTQVSNPILAPFAWVMGKILNLIYLLVDKLGIPNIAICIILFTIVMKMLTLPLTIKQQKSAKVSAKMQPEIQAIQEKYRGIDRSDRNAMMRMTEEQQAVYRKYGSSPFGGCLPLILMFIIIFALYNVIYAIPAYVKPVKEMYKPVSSAILDEVEGTEFEETYTKALQEFLKHEGLSIRSKSTNKAEKWNENQLIDALSVFSTSAWDHFLNCDPIYKEDKVQGITLEDKVFDDKNYKEWNAFCTSDIFKKIVEGKEDAKKQILRVNSIFGKYSVLDPPGWKLTPMLLIPILSALLQFLQTKLSMAVQKSGDDKKKNATPGAMEGMLKIMPIISGIFCVIFPIGVGLYWVINSAVSIVQQYFINKRLDKISIDDIVAANEAKEAERMKKLGIVSNSNTTSNIARTNTKTISAIAANNNSSNKGKNSDDRKPSQKISDRKKDELSKNAAEGKSNISAIANLFRGDDEEDK